MTRYVLTLAPLLSSVALISTLTACEPATPCDEYVDYICDCHSDDARPGYDCETLRVTYENADASLSVTLRPSAALATRRTSSCCPLMLGVTPGTVS